jgi:hypothetical protein
MCRHHGWQRPVGACARSAAFPGPLRRREVRTRVHRGRHRGGRRVPDAVHVLPGELEPAGARGRRADALLRRYARQEREELQRQGVEVRVYGDLDRLAAGRGGRCEEIESHTRGGRNLKLNLMISYGARAEIARAARRLAERVARGELHPGDRRGHPCQRALHGRDSRSGPAHPHIGRAAHQQLPALATRVHRAVRDAGALAGLPARAPLAGHLRLPEARAPLRSGHRRLSRWRAS